ncbi:MAG: hypothetical protein NTZ16_10435, partial [Verrucomicrobia bacterium]|nr:hypothetical protein [Verrucomicrobiota bacterium]
MKTSRFASVLFFLAAVGGEAAMPGDPVVLCPLYRSFSIAAGATNYNLITTPVGAKFYERFIGYALDADQPGTLPLWRYTGRKGAVKISATGETAPWGDKQLVGY